jgi:hypothetical protein
MQNTCANNAQVNEQAQLGVGLYHPTLEMTAAPQAGVAIQETRTGSEESSMSNKNVAYLNRLLIWGKA